MEIRMTPDCAPQKLSDEWLGTIIAFLLLATSASIFLTYLIPQWYSFVTSKVFIFTNGWDEEFYLSWQGVEGGKNITGLYPLHLAWVMQKLGVSGAVQNLFCDTVIPPTTAFLVYLSLRKFDLPVAKAAGYAALICFGSVLFNASNPVISHQLGETRTATVWFMSPWEVYPSILRTPNPEIPFFLISIAVYLYVRFGKWWLLFLPLPLLYYFTAVAYVFVLLVSFAYSQLQLRFSLEWRTALASGSVFTYIAMGVGLVLLSYVTGLYRPDNLIRNTPYLFSESRRPQFPVGTLILMALFVLGIRTGWLRLERRWLVAVLILGAASIGSANFHLFTGFMLSQKNYYDYGLSVLFSTAVVIGIHAIRLEVARGFTLVVVLAFISLLSYRSQKIWLGQAVEYGARISSDLEKIRQDPLRAIIPDWMAAGRVAFSTPQLISPISYLYWYDVVSQCAMFPAWVANAMNFEKTHLNPGSRELKESLDVVEKILAARRVQKNVLPDLPYCAGLDYLNKDFYIVTPK
jgi:hypothetical protein